MELQRLTHFDKHGLARVAHTAGSGRHARAQVCLRRPPSARPTRALRALDRIGGLDRSRGSRAGLLSEASIEPDERLSTHPALPVRTVNAGEAFPFSRLVAASEVVLPYVKGQRLLGIADDVGPSNSPCDRAYRTLLPKSAGNGGNGSNAANSRRFKRTSLLGICRVSA